LPNQRGRRKPSIRIPQLNRRGGEEEKRKMRQEEEASFSSSKEGSTFQGYIGCSPKSLVILGFDPDELVHV